MRLHTTSSQVPHRPGNRNRIICSKMQELCTRSLHLPSYPPCWAADCPECGFEEARSGTVYIFHGNPDTTEFSGHSSVTSGGIWGAGTMSRKTLVKVYVAHGFTNILGSATKCLLQQEAWTPWPSQPSWPMPAHSPLIRGFIPCMSLICHRRTGNELLHFSEWHSLQRNGCRIKYMTLVTYLSVMNLESNK